MNWNYEDGFFSVTGILRQTAHKKIKFHLFEHPPPSNPLVFETDYVVI